jgi:outer membrane protein assembly factor BamB
MLVEMKEQFGVEHEERAVGFVEGSLPNHLVLTRTGSVFGCSLSDGELLWHAPVDVPYFWPNVHDGRIYVFCPPRFIAIDEASGVVLYDVTHPELERALFPKTGTVYEDKITFATESGHLPVFDLRDGRLVWSHVRKASLGRTAEADGRLLVTTDRGELLVFGD